MAYFSESELAQWLERLSIDLVSIGSNITSYFILFFLIYFTTQSINSPRKRKRKFITKSVLKTPFTLIIFLNRDYYKVKKTLFFMFTVYVKC